jgi:H+-translocating NAD(P) transhydrogenase subunit alpha
MKIAIPGESDKSEPRVAASPETVGKFAALGAEVAVAAGAGKRAWVTDEAYREAGATIAKTFEATVKDADIVLKVRRPSAAEAGKMKNGAAVVALMDPYGNEEAVAKLADAGVVAFAMELMPRITRAQSMDALSSMATVAGYRAVLLAALELPRMFPLLMTAAGTIPPARVLVIGAGVAGLQAIATARRRGAVVKAYDVREAARNEVQPLRRACPAMADSCPTLPQWLAPPMSCRESSSAS